MVFLCFVTHYSKEEQIDANKNEIFIFCGNLCAKIIGYIPYSTKGKLFEGPISITFAFSLNLKRYCTC
jgi:hypothetical protein